MKLDGHRLGLAAAATSAILFTACSIFLHLWPEQTLQLRAALFHLYDFGPLTPLFGISARIYVSGLVQSSLISYIALYLFAYIYNYMNKKR